MDSELLSQWIKTPLDAIATTTSGGTPNRKQPDFYGGGIPWVKSGELNDSYIFETEETITQEGLKNSSAKLFPAGTLLIAMYGATVGKTAILKIPAATNQAVCGISPDTERADSDFLRYYLISEREELLSQRYGGAQPNISQNIIRNFTVQLPPLPEQRKIAAILSTVQKAIEQQEQIIQTTTELKKALMQKLFTEGLRGEKQKKTEIGLVPESWEVLEFDKFVTLQRGYDLRKQDFKRGKIPVIGATQVIGYHDKANVKGPGVTVVRSGSSAGMPLFINEDFWAHNVVLYVKNYHGNIPKFVYYKIQSLDLTKYRQGVAVPTLNRNTFASLKIAIPAPDDQQRITEALDSVENKSLFAVKKKTLLENLFRTLLHQLMTAQVRIEECCYGDINNEQNAH